MATPGGPSEIGQVSVGVTANIDPLLAGLDEAKDKAKEKGEDVGEAAAEGLADGLGVLAAKATAVIATFTLFERMGEKMAATLREATRATLELADAQDRLQHGRSREFEMQQRRIDQIADPNVRAGADELQAQREMSTQKADQLQAETSTEAALTQDRKDVFLRNTLRAATFGVYGYSTDLEQKKNEEAKLRASADANAKQIDALITNALGANGYGSILADEAEARGVSVSAGLRSVGPDLGPAGGMALRNSAHGMSAEMFHNTISSLSYKGRNDMAIEAQRQNRKGVSTQGP
jgi:hypothetical protein